MKIISLNTFGGTVFAPLTDFIRSVAQDTDVFCFQEVLSDARNLPSKTLRGFRGNFLQELSAILPDFSPVFAPVPEIADIDEADRTFVQTGLATFVRNRLTLVSSDHLLLCDEAYKEARGGLVGHSALFTTLRHHDQLLTICNVHGMSHPGDKRDTPERLTQSHLILNTLAQTTGAKIVVGDFNLLPETQSVALFEGAGFRNLIKDHGIASTRGTHHRILHPEFEHQPNGFQDFADYAFVNALVTVRSFDVPDLPISDHLPLIMTCEITSAS